MQTSPRKIALAVGMLAVLSGVTLAAIHDTGAGAVGIANAQPAEAQAPQVDVATVVAKAVTEWQSYSGRLEAVDKVEIRPQVAGRIVAVHFADGALVAKGARLFTIDPRPYEADVARAEAQLAAAEARAAHAQSESARAERLMAGDAIAKRDYDERQNAARETAADVKAARAAVESARVDRAYTQITAPVAGRASRAELTVGNIVSTGSTAPLLTTVVSVSPIYASFSVDEQTYLRYLRTASSTGAPVALGLATEQGYSREGKVVSVDNQLDAVSATIRVRARFDNADGALLPGLYARIKVGGGKSRSAVMVDDSAIGTDQSKKFVLVVDADSRAQYREVQLGNLHEGQRIVEQGLEPGDQVVVNGTQRARPGDKVTTRSVDMATVSHTPKSAA